LSATPPFSVIICTYQRYDILPQAIASLANQDIGADNYDIWVMDNSPPSPERAISQKQYAHIPNLHYITLDTPGLANARNEGVTRSTGQHILFMDDDAVADNGLLRHYRDAFSQAPPDVAAIGGRITPHFEIPRPPWLHEANLHFLSLFDHDTAFPDYQPCGANMAFRRKAFDLGSFFTGLGRRGNETNNLLSGEETSLNESILRSGGKFAYAPLARVTHSIAANRLTHAWFRRRASWQAISDQMRDPLRPEDAAKVWPFIMDYVMTVPREHLPFMGMFWDTDDANLFRMQLICTQLMTQIMISQGKYPDGMVG